MITYYKQLHEVERLSVWAEHQPSTRLDSASQIACSRAVGCRRGVVWFRGGNIYISSTNRMVDGLEKVFLAGVAEVNVMSNALPLC